MATRKRGQNPTTRHTNIASHQPASQLHIKPATIASLWLEGLLGSTDQKLRDNSNTVDKRELRRALPEMNNTLSYWTLHGQNLGLMLANYRAQCGKMKKKRRSELAHFFNTTSNILDTIGSMTENIILRSVKFDKDLVGGSMEKKKAISNKPPVPLFPTEESLSRYAAVFPSY